MKVLITGAAGQLGIVLKNTAPANYILDALNRDMDITDPDAVTKVMHELRPDVLINTAAYTAVDRAESEPDKAYAANTYGPEILAKCCHAQGTRLVHISTDFVFDGLKSRPYEVSDERRPLGVYGASKSEGEDRVRTVMGEKATIIRSGWIYAAEGRNFVKTMLHLMEAEKELRVISDQVGTPTWAKPLAQLIWTISARPEIHGLLHWSDAGVASWYDFAVAIQEEALALGLLTHTIPIHAILTEAYPLPARRPPYSVLDKQETIRQTGCIPAHWRVNLRCMLKDLVHA